MYSHEIATYGVESTFDQRLAKGFVELWGIQSTEANKLQKEKEIKNMNCPECDAKLNIPEDAAVGEIVSCADCGADYEISKKERIKH